MQPCVFPWAATRTNRRPRTGVRGGGYPLSPSRSARPLNRPCPCAPPCSSTGSAKHCCRHHGAPRSVNALSHAIRVLEARAQFSEPAEIHQRFASTPDQFILDLENANCEVGEITPQGWTVAPARDLYFRASRNAHPLPARQSTRSHSQLPRNLWPRSSPIGLASGGVEEKRALCGLEDVLDGDLHLRGA